jgi:hypothetical protein
MLANDATTSENWKKKSLPRSSSENICNSSGTLGEKERQDETQFTTKIGGETSLGTSYFVL